MTLPTLWMTSAGLDLQAFDAVVHVGLGSGDPAKIIVRPPRRGPLLAFSCALWLSASSWCPSVLCGCGCCGRCGALL
jgi:hypothetical protein